MTDADLSDAVATSVADGLALVRFASTDSTWPGKADEWAAALDEVDHRLAELAHLVGCHVTPPSTHWSRGQRDATVEAIAVHLDHDDAVALRKAFRVA
jgi:hypothetical protein